jgi:hypothetical protein
MGTNEIEDSGLSYLLSSMPHAHGKSLLSDYSDILGTYFTFLEAVKRLSRL